MTITDDLAEKRDAIEASILAMSVCIAQQTYLLSLIIGCIGNPSQDNLAILEATEQDQWNWLGRMMKPPAPLTEPVKQRAGSEGDFHE